MHDGGWTFTDIDTKNGSPTFYIRGLKSVHFSYIIHTFPIIASNKTPLCWSFLQVPSIREVRNQETFEHHASPCLFSVKYPHVPLHSGGTVLTSDWSVNSATIFLCENILVVFCTEISN